MRLSPSICAAIFSALFAAVRAHAALPAGYTYTTFDLPSAQQTVLHGMYGNTLFGNYVDSQGAPHGFLYEGGTLVNVDNPLGVKGTVVKGISGNTIVGDYTDAQFHQRGFILNNGTFTTLEIPNSIFTNANAIYNNVVVGTFIDAQQVSHGFLYDGTVTIQLDNPDTEPSHGTVFRGIYGNTMVGGYSGTDGIVAHGFIYNGFKYQTFDHPPVINLGSEAYAIAGNYITGYYDVGMLTHGYVSDGTSFLTVDVPTAVTTFPSGVWTDGTVVGTYQANDRLQTLHSFIATPVPEPVSLLPVAILAGLIRRRRKDH